MFKLVGLGLAASLLFAPTAGFADTSLPQNSLTPEVSAVTEAVPANVYTFKNNILEGPGTKILVGEDIEFDEPEISLFSEAYKIVPVRHIGGAFNDSFTCTPSDGVHLNIWTLNNSNYPVQFQVKINGQIITDQTVEAGGQKTIRSEDMLGVGLNASYSVYIYSTTGHQLDVNVSARQF
ncbi:hypothetical protein R70723_23585 [Paenibacillus sp. FSL R7-0273]|uniref:hypothetical protein n=1 Tax=Paenibacillus sp. FSL R7-0273 TaxID=1536772 RepID=UPI0004F62B95|nr:hypothetical protein [Paenibacillus sp. FSL R7-0273]AIQ48561.1 hypothetical protein R70723_23585 [Paenibacillus sp. FSL R7-0273]OMF87585.1 hypothetical protein BK144_23510 [Paenibacillus sp. FSL R7-0273]